MTFKLLMGRNFLKHTCGSAAKYKYPDGEKPWETDTDDSPHIPGTRAPEQAFHQSHAQPQSPSSVNSTCPQQSRGGAGVGRAPTLGLTRPSGPDLDGLQLSFADQAPADPKESLNSGGSGVGPETLHFRQAPRPRWSLPVLGHHLEHQGGDEDVKSSQEGSRSQASLLRHRI